MNESWQNAETPLALARELWRVDNIPEVCALSPAQFRQLFDRVYEATDDVEALWQLGGATNDYLRSNPSAFEVPLDLARRLLYSDDVEARVIGLKLLNRRSDVVEEIVSEIVRALARQDNYESTGGIHELGEFLDRLETTGASLDSAQTNAIRRALATLFEIAKCDEDRSFAASAMDRLRG
jgi:hypothetical protein